MTASKKPRLDRVPVAGVGRAKFIDVEHGATRGAMIGRDLYDSDGSAITDLGAWIRANAIARDCARLNGVPVGKIINRNGTLVVREIQTEAIQAGDLGAVVNIAGGGVTAASGGNTLALGAGFGVDTLVLYFGPSPANMAAATKAGALIWFDNAGNAYFGGTLSAKHVQEGGLAASGLNLVANPSFTSNKVGAPAATNLATGAQACDGWVVVDSEPAFPAAFIRSQPGIIYCRVSNDPIPNGVTVAPQARTIDPVAIDATATYNVGFTYDGAFSGTLAGTIDCNGRFSVQFLDANLGIVQTKNYLCPRNGGGTITATVVPPATAKWAYFYVDVLVKNNSGASYTHSTSTLFQCSFNSVWCNKAALSEVAGSGVQVGDQGNLPPVRVASFGSRWSGAAITYSFPTTGSPAVVTINVAAGTLVAGDFSQAYSASSGTVSQARSTTQTYYLYYTDAAWAGGAQTLNIVQAAANLSNANGRLFVGSVDVTVPAIGTGGSGGGDGGGGCVDGAMWVDEHAQAEQVVVGDFLEILDPDVPLGLCLHAVGHQEIRIAPTWRIRTAGGAELAAGETTPFTLRDGSSLTIDAMLGQDVVTDRAGVLAWERVVACDFVGMRPVCHLSVGGNSYFAGKHPRYRIASHNALKP